MYLPPSMAYIHPKGAKLVVSEVLIVRRTIILHNNTYLLLYGQYELLFC